MLGKRIVTALVLLAILVPALLAPWAWPFQLLTLAMIAAAGWEWSRLSGLGGSAALAYGAAVALLCLALWASSYVPAPAFWFGLAIGLPVSGAMVLRGGSAAWAAKTTTGRLVAGVALLVPAWWAISVARGMGVNFVLSTMALVWAADIFAYLFGRLFGRHKLAPSVSPGKTWEGALGGVLGVWLLAWLWIQADARWTFDGPSLYSLLTGHAGWVLAAVLLVGLAALSVLGDLMESLVKRAAGVKDSSGLLPGHGGVLDRIDALLPVAPAALAALALARSLGTASGVG